MKAYFTFCFFLLLPTVLFSQPVSKNWDTALMPQGYPIQTPGVNVSNTGFNNPAFLSRINGISAGVSYQYGATIEKAYIGQMMGKNLVNGLPYSAAVSYQTGNLHFGAAIAQRYNLRIDSGPIPVTTVENPDGTDKTGNLINDRDIHDYSVISSYNIKDLPGGNSLSLGLRVSLGRLSYFDNNTFGPQAKITETSAYAMAFALGAGYKIATGSGEVNLGAFFEKGYDFRKFVHIEFDRSALTGPNNRVYYLTDPSFNLEISTPDAIRLDFAYDLPKVQITANLSEIFWNSASDNYKNNLDFSAGAYYRTNEMLSLFFGVSMNDRKNSDSFPNYFNKYYNALFLTLGAEAAYGSYTLGMSVSDSHLLSAETRRQTLGRLTLGYQF